MIEEAIFAKDSPISHFISTLPTSFIEFPIFFDYTEN
jgi:hypothetical protein